MINEIHSDANSRMDKSLASLENDFSKIRAGRAHPSLLEQVTVEYYGTMVPLSQVSNITAEDARTLKVSPWEKDMVGPIEKAILTSDLGLNPNTQGQVMRIPLPPLTEDRRRELVRVVRAIETNDFNKLLSKFKKLDCEVYGISKDSLKSHDKFRDKYKIKFDLLADEELKVLKKYKVWGKKKFMGREFMGIIRTTFLIDKHGKIIRIWENVKVKDHAKEVLETLKNISKK